MFGPTYDSTTTKTQTRDFSRVCVLVVVESEVGPNMHGPLCITPSHLAAMPSKRLQASIDLCLTSYKLHLATFRI